MAAANFEACFSETERWEGFHKFSDDPRDPGGATWCGLTQRVYWAWRKIQGLSPEFLPVQKASDDDVRAIFRKQYWDSVQGDNLWPGLDLLMFDRAINEGPTRPIKDLQRIVGVRVDGQLGLETLHAIQTQPQHTAILARLHKARLGYWMSLTSLWRVFGRGWSNREKDVYVVAQKMMYEATAS